jgi:hypothetical protein
MAIILEDQRGINKKHKNAMHLATQMINMNLVAGLVVGYFLALKEQYKFKMIIRFLPKRRKWVHHNLKSSSTTKKQDNKKGKGKFLQFDILCFCKNK